MIFNMRKWTVLVAVFSIAAGVLSAEPASPVREVMQGFVDRKVISGGVTIVANKDKLLQLEAVGYSDLAKREAMRADHLFWIASMTKPLVGVCILQLQEEGKLSVEDSVEKHLPEFKGQWMVHERSKKRLVLEPPPRPITIRDLLTHTSGLTNVSAPRNDSTLAELAMAYSKSPLNFEPGTRWQYSNPGINTLGRIVEIVSGERFEIFLQKRILDPCGMKDTTFWPDEAQAKRLAKTYRAIDGELEEAGIYFTKGKLVDRSRTPYPAGGLFSTAVDMMRFYQMMLHGGVANGQRVLKKKSVKELTRTQTGDIKTGFVTGMSWGLGFQVVKEPQGVTAMVSPGTYGHGGAYATNSWADPKTGLIYILMIQRAGFPNADNSPVRKAFQQAAADQFAR
tara:strand:+ start:885 stop:2069 length:1185 start_codon:yes stop_codon:yes gene_type:complete